MVHEESGIVTSQTAKEVVQYKPLLLIDFSQDVDYNLFYPPSDSSMSKALGGTQSGWSADKVRLAMSMHNILGNIPRMCYGKRDCPVGSLCPIGDDQITIRFKDKNCPVEVVDAFKLFAGYVIDLSIKPEDFVDLELVSDLVRITILEKRVDEYNKGVGVTVDEPYLIDKQSGEVHTRVVANSTFAILNTFRKDKDSIYKQLVASREARNKESKANLNAISSATELFSKIKVAAAALEDNKKGRVRSKKSDIIDADYTTGD